MDPKREDFDGVSSVSVMPSNVEAVCTLNSVTAKRIGSPPAAAFTEFLMLAKLLPKTSPAELYCW
jgi:hypothetical protein